MTHQVFDHLDHGPECHVQPWDLLPSGLLGRRGLDRQHQAVMDVLGADQAGSLPGPTQHVEHLEQGYRWPHADVHLAKVDEDRHQNEGVQR
jgi:hypothetical protein